MQIIASSILQYHYLTPSGPAKGQACRLKAVNDFISALSQGADRLPCSLPELPDCQCVFHSSEGGWWFSGGQI